MQEHHLTVRRTARYYTLGGQVPDPVEIWLVCHGYGQLAGHFLEAFEPLDDGRRLIVAPEALSRFYLEAGSHGPESKVGATWMTREDRLSEIEDYVTYLDALRDVVSAGAHHDEPPLTVLGFSQGTATAARWVARGKARASRLVVWGSLLPPDLDLQAAAAALGALDLVLVAGTQDEYVTPERLAAQRAALDAAGVRYRVLTFHGGHRLDAGTLRRLASG
jgi:predicted esterase